MPSTARLSCSMANFYDHFSGHAELYNRHRPLYPEQLYEWLAGQCERHECALDAATGGGQAAIGLADHFERVVGVDASRQQLSAARAHGRIDYVLANAEALPLKSGSVDVVTVAQALHWLDRPEVYEELRRVARIGALVCAWSYQLFQIDPEVDAVMDRFYRGRLDPYWPPQRAHVRDHYATLTFPFAEVETPELAMHPEWTRDDLLAQVSTWSAVRRHDAATGTNAVALLEPELTEAWPADDRKRVVWSLNFRAGRI